MNSVTYCVHCIPSFFFNQNIVIITVHGDLGAWQTTYWIQHDKKRAENTLCQIFPTNASYICYFLITSCLIILPVSSLTLITSSAEFSNIIQYSYPVIAFSYFCHCLISPKMSTPKSIRVTTFKNLNLFALQ